MRRTVATALIAAGLVAASATPSFAGKPSDPALDYVLSGGVGAPWAGYCTANLRAEFNQTPTTLPTGWAGTLALDSSRKTQSIQLNAGADGSAGFSMMVAEGSTLTVTIAPVYGKKKGTPVQGTYTCA